MNHADLRILEQAARSVGFPFSDADLIRSSENQIYRLPGKRVARIARVGQQVTAAREVEIANWLEDHAVPAVRALRDVRQPVVIDGHAVTFWRELSAHTPGTTVDVATAISRLHSLPIPKTFTLPHLNPFVRLTDRVSEAVTLSSDDRAWMLARIMELNVRYSELADGLPECVVHGDAWAGNVVRTTDGTVTLLDFERCSIGRPEWDLVSTAVSYVTTGWLGREEWTKYCNAYGADVTSWSGFPVLRDIRELRMTTMAAQVAAQNPERYASQAAHRVACLRGVHGPRPWPGWQAVP